MFWCLILTASSTAAQPRFTFTRDVASILWARCATCHRPGEIGPFSLITYDDVKRRATQIGAVTARRVMPPWKPRPGSGEFQNERRLSDRELQILQAWIADGAPEGNMSDLPPAPPPVTTANAAWQLGTPDLVVTMPQSYTVRADGADVFRTFVIPIPTDAPRYVRALEFHPGNARVVHHANLGVDRTRSSRQLDARDGEPGYTGGMERDARYPEGQLLGWTPGQAAHAVPEGTQWRLEPGSDLIVQLHLQPTGKAETVKISAGFYFTDTPPTRTPIGLRLGSETIDIPAGTRDYVVRDSYTLPTAADVVAIQPHAHNLARRMEATATLPDGSHRSLITIDDWDFRWQDVYRYTTPIELPKGATIEMRYLYDNSAANPRNPHAPPARVVWGQNTSDEMGDLWVQVVPKSPADGAILGEDFRRKAHAEDLAAYTRLLQGDPANPLRHDAVAQLYLDEGKLDEAIAEFRRSLQLNGESATTHYNLGYALSARGRREEAMAELSEALRLDPDYSLAHNNLGALLEVTGRMDEAQAHFERAVALRPDNIEARSNLAQLLSNHGRAAAAAEQFRAVLALRADHVQALAGLAWIQATAADPALRNPEEAIHRAERAVDLTSGHDVVALDALAAAYASAGRYDAAARIARLGLDAATLAGQTAAAAQFRQRLELYRSGQSLRLPQ
ncbi:MAG TPA: tetratricopeptide repeat protein [Vicinamibacterales bacterium]|nr:tetratricopeptide repeat protein [Vicinamibacterales bacterium]